MAHCPRAKTAHARILGWTPHRFAISRKEHRIVRKGSAQGVPHWFASGLHLKKDCSQPLAFSQAFGPTQPPCAAEVGESESSREGSPAITKRRSRAMPAESFVCKLQADVSLCIVVDMNEVHAVSCNSTMTCCRVPISRRFEKRTSRPFRLLFLPLLHHQLQTAPSPVTCPSIQHLEKPPTAHSLLTQPTIAGCLFLSFEKQCQRKVLFPCRCKKVACGRRPCL